jgi:hypothetical protein
VLVSAACNSGSTANVQNPPPPVTQAVAIAFQSTPPSGVSVGSTTSLTATVTNDNTNGGTGSGVDWTITCGNGNCGTLSAPHTASGQAVTYTPPSSLPGNNEIVNIAAFATADHTKNVLASITVTAFGSNLMGTYVLSAQGSQNSAPFQVVAALVLDGSGNISAGESTFDFLDPNTGSVTSSTGAIVPIGSSYFLGPDGRGSITINTSNNSIGPQTFSLAYLSNAHLLVGAQPSNNNPLIVSASGTMDLQTATGLSTPSGGYAFVLNGTDFNGSGPTGIGGVFDVDNQSNNPNNISGANSIADEDSYAGGSPTFYPRMPLNGTVGAPDQFGAFSLSLNFNNFNLTTPSINVTGYIVDGAHVMLIETDSSGAGSLAGMAIAQGSATGSFVSPASFAGTYVFGLEGVDFASTLPDTFTAAGVINPDGAGSLTTGFADSTFQSLTNPITGIGPAQISGTFSGTYLSSAPTGRYQASLQHFSTPNQPYTPQLIFYLTGPGSPALVLAVGNTAQNYLFPFFATGVAYPQATGPLSFSGSYGLYFSQQNGTEYDGTGVMNVSAPSFAGTLDVGPATDQDFSGNFSSTSCSSAVNGCFAATFANSVGSTGLQGVNLTNSSTAFAADFYMIDSTQGFFVENDLAQQSTPQVSFGYFSASKLPQQSAAAARKARHK